MQGRAYHYHLFPFFGFALPVIDLLASRLLEKDCGPRLAPFLTVALIAGLAYAIVPPDRDYPTHAQYRNFPLTRLIATCDGRGGACPFFMFNDSMGIVQETAYYAGQPYASRFPSFWFLPSLLDASAGALPAAERDQDFHRFARMAAADLDGRQPRLLLIGRFDVFEKPFDFVGYFRRDPDFNRAFGNYEFVRRITLDRSVYNRGTVLAAEKASVFDLYVRR